MAALQWKRVQTPEVNRVVTDYEQMESLISDLRKRQKELLVGLPEKACPYKLGQLFRCEIKVKVKVGRKKEYKDQTRYARLVMIGECQGEPWYVMRGALLKKNGEDGNMLRKLYPFEDWKPVDSVDAGEVTEAEIMNWGPSDEDGEGNKE